MAYFIKTSHTSKGDYYQIYDSFYDPEKKQTAQKAFRPLGYASVLKAAGIGDPKAHFQAEVDRLNAERKNQRDVDKVRQITEVSPERYLGYFPFKSVNDGLGVRKYIDVLQQTYGFEFSLYDMLSSLIYARVVQPCSKSKTFHDVLPSLMEGRGFSQDQMYRGIACIGNEYEKIIEIYNNAMPAVYSFDVSNVYFDCTNFYFEIDREDGFRMKGPSKENRTDPLVAMGLLLDANAVPIGMRVFPGNESEKPVIRETIDSLKERHGITGRTIQVADKGLNCSENICHAIEGGDGYLFSESVKMMSEVERKWVLLDNGYEEVKDEKGRLLYKIKDCVDDFDYRIKDARGKAVTVKLPEKRVATYNPDLAKKKLYEIDRLVEKARSKCVSQAKKNELGECSKYVNFKPADKKGNETDGKVATSINEAAIAENRAIAGYNVLVTSEVKMGKRDIYSMYHNLWRIEESFRVMKSQLDARPVYLQKQDTITGHLLICYLGVLLLRLMQFVILENKYSSEDIMGMVKGFRAVQASERKHINITRNTKFIKEFADFTSLPLASFYLSDSQVKRIMKCKL